MKRLEIFDEESRTRSDPLSSCLSEEQVRHASRRTSLFLIDPASALWTVTNPTCRSRGFPRPLNQLQFTFWYSFFYTKYLSYISPSQSVCPSLPDFYSRRSRIFLQEGPQTLFEWNIFAPRHQIFIQDLLATTFVGCKRPLKTLRFIKDSKNVSFIILFNQFILQYSKENCKDSIDIFFFLPKKWLTSFYHITQLKLMSMKLLKINTKFRNLQEIL